MNVLWGAKNYVTGALGLGSSNENSGALDVMVVQHEDGVMSCTPFHVRFSKVQPRRNKERVIQLRVNGRTVPLCMKLGVAGEAFFVERAHNPLRRDLMTSPLASPVHGDGERGEGRAWEEPSNQDDWSTRQLRNYQLLSDLSSDEEAATYRRSFNTPEPSPHRGEAQVGPPSPFSSPPAATLPPVLGSASPHSKQMIETFESEDSGRESVANRSEKLDANFGDGGGNVMDDGLGTARPGGVPMVDGVSEWRAGLNSTKLDGVGVVPSSDGLAVRSSDLGTATSAASAAGKPRDEANEATVRGSIDSVSRKEESKEWNEGDGDGDEEDNADGDGDEEDNADGDEDGDAGVDGDSTAGGGGSGGGEGREGEEGSWWWSWTWGALPVRRKPKSTRRKHTRRKRSRGSNEGLLEGSGSTPVVDELRPDHAAAESVATPLSSALPASEPGHSSQLSLEALTRVTSASAVEREGRGGRGSGGSVVDGCAGYRASPPPDAALAEGIREGVGPSDARRAGITDEIGNRARDHSVDNGQSPSTSSADSGTGHSLKGSDVAVQGAADSSTIPLPLEAEAVAAAAATPAAGPNGVGAAEIERSAGQSEPSCPPPSTAYSLERISGDSDVGDSDGRLAGARESAVATGDNNNRPTPATQEIAMSSREEQLSQGAWIGRGGSDDGFDGPSTRSTGTLTPGQPPERPAPRDLLPFLTADVAGGGAPHAGGAKLDPSAATAMSAVTPTVLQEAAAVFEAVAGPMTSLDDERRDTDVDKHDGNAPRSSDVLPTSGDNQRQGISRKDADRESVAGYSSPAVPVAQGAEAALRSAVAGEVCATAPSVAVPTSDRRSLSSLGAYASSTSTRCVFPGDEASEMNEMVVAVESVTPDVEAWLSGDPAAVKVSDAAVTGASSDGESDGASDGGNDSGSTRPPQPPQPPTDGLQRNMNGVACSHDCKLNGIDSRTCTTRHAIAAPARHTPSAVRPLVGRPSQAVSAAGSVETTPAVAPAWSDGVGHVYPPTTQAGPFLASPSESLGSTGNFGALVDESSRHGSVADLRGFHTPHGGSVTNLCELSVLAESSVYEGVGQTQHQRLLDALGSSPTTPSSSEAMVSALPDTNLVSSTPTNAAPDCRERDSNDSAVRELGFTASGVSEDSAAEALDELPVSAATVSNNGVMPRRDMYAGEGRIAATRLASTMPRATMGTRALQAAPVMSLSGHLIGPELRRGDGGEEAHKCARRAFMSEAVTWHHFSRHSQEILQDRRLLVAIDGRLLTLSEALPHFVAASVFGRPLLQISSPATTEPLADGARATRGDVAGSGALDGRGRGSGNAPASSNGNDSNASNASNAESDDGRGGSVASSTPRADDAAAATSIATGAASCTGPGSGRIDGAGEGGVGVAGDPSIRPREGTGEGDESEAPGTWWGVGGWFSRRSSLSPPPPVDGAVGGGGVRSVLGEGAGEPGQVREAGGRPLEYQPDGAKAGDAPDKKENVVAPPSLSMELVGKAAVSNDRSNEGGAVGAGGGFGDSEHGHDDDDEEEDIYGKTLRPTSEQLAALRLRAGCNMVEFVANIAGQAERVVTARVFLWGSGAKVVVSDIEGTIARSGGGPGVGSFTPVVGPGVHKDVSTLFTKIAANGYKILYLTSRPLADWHAKKGLEDGGGLPLGPVLCSPEALFRNPSSRDRRSHHQEVFKMTALRGVKLIFPADVNPLYAGFGNSVSDMVAYKKMSVPEGRIFLSNSRGGLHKINHTYRQTYLSLSEHVDLTFPPLPHDGADDDDYESEQDREAPNGHGVINTADIAANDVMADRNGQAASAGGGGDGSEATNGNTNGINNVNGAASVAGGPLPGSGSGNGVACTERGVSAGGEASTGAGSLRGARVSGLVTTSASNSMSSSGNWGSWSTAVPRRWAEVAPKREKSFYPNRAAVEDQFTDLNYWRDPPRLIGDDGEDDTDHDDDDDTDHDVDEGDLYGVGDGASPHRE